MAIVIKYTHRENGEISNKTYVYQLQYLFDKLKPYLCC